MALIFRRILLSIIFILALGMFLSTFAQVIFRFVLKHPLAWSEELARYLMVWVACLGASEAYRQKSHVGVDFVCDLLPPGLQRWVHQIAHLGVLILMAVIVYQGLYLSWMLQDQRSPAMDMPMAYAYLALPVGAFLIGIYAVVNLIRGFGRGETAPAPDNG